MISIIILLAILLLCDINITITRTDKPFLGIQMEY